MISMKIRDRIFVDRVRKEHAHQTNETDLERGAVHHQIDCENDRDDPVKKLCAESIGNVDDFVQIIRKGPGDRLQELVTGCDELGQVNVVI